MEKALQHGRRKAFSQYRWKRWELKSQVELSSDNSLATPPRGNFRQLRKLHRCGRFNSWIGKQLPIHTSGINIKASDKRGFYIYVVEAVGIEPTSENLL